MQHMQLVRDEQAKGASREGPVSAQGQLRFGQALSCADGEGHERNLQGMSNVMYC